MAEVIYYKPEDTSRPMDICQYGSDWDPKASVRVTQVAEVEPEKAESD